MPIAVSTLSRKLLIRLINLKKTSRSTYIHINHVYCAGLKQSEPKATPSPMAGRASLLGEARRSDDPPPQVEVPLHSRRTSATDANRLPNSFASGELQVPLSSVLFECYPLSYGHALESLIP